jgi:glyoxalase family protein
MELEGIHHVTCITADATRNVAFYTGVLGLRLVAKSVNQDDPTVYHLFFSDESGDPGADITFFEYRDARPGRAGDGMVHTIVWRVASAVALEFWHRRLAARGASAARVGDEVHARDPEGLAHAIRVDTSGDRTLTARHPEIPPELALTGFDAVRAYGRRPERARALLEDVLGARALDDRTWELRGAGRGGTIRFDDPPAERGIPGAGTVHHVAWGTTVAEHPHWLERLTANGVRHSGVIDRHYFHSIYFREPNGVLFELADDAPGFTVDTPLAQLGTRITLPPRLESQRAEIERRLAPLPDPRARWPIAR